ncbi:hypothetical protein LZ30DRAFT_736529 [Colletotrichum cereale]|nr:hypothetical protein LZ30DRAFT_736529 [Colletotrichum cereale]
MRRSGGKAAALTVKKQTLIPSGVAGPASRWKPTGNSHLTLDNKPCLDRRSVQRTNPGSQRVKKTCSGIRSQTANFQLNLILVTHAPKKPAKKKRKPNLHRIDELSRGRPLCYGRDHKRVRSGAKHVSRYRKYARHTCIAASCHHVGRGRRMGRGPVTVSGSKVRPETNHP